MIYLFAPPTSVKEVILAGEMTNSTARWMRRIQRMYLLSSILQRLSDVFEEKREQQKKDYKHLPEDQLALAILPHG